MKVKNLKDLDSLLSIAQMPKGIPVGTLAIGEDGAINAALLAASIIGNKILRFKKNLKQLRLSSKHNLLKKNLNNFKYVKTNSWNYWWRSIRQYACYCCKKLRRLKQLFFVMILMHQHKIFLMTLFMGNTMIKTK